LFAARGFARVTVRDICRAAHANVAAINYHFHGKKGLYDGVVQTAIERMQGTTEAIVAAGRDQTPERQLTAYVAIFLQRVTEMRDNWIHQLMVRELTEPTPALDLVVREVLQPRMQYLAGIVAALLRCRTDDPRVARAVMSVHMQCLTAIDRRLPGFAAPRPRRGGLQLPGAPTTPAAVAELADHIARFSIGGIDAISRPTRSQPRTEQETRPGRREPLRRRPLRP
jgi:AcrR family transcriptional regulator